MRMVDDGGRIERTNDSWPPIRIPGYVIVGPCE